MSAVSVDELTQLSRLLDEALAMAAPEREAWLAALPASAPREQLAYLLASHDELQATDGGFLDRLPELPPHLVEAPAGQPGDRIGPYRLLRSLGRGGMGEVWLAERADGLFERQVALKLPRRRWSGDALAHEQFRRETGLVARLEHPRIARLYDAGLQADANDQLRPYLAMAFVEGRPLDEAAAALPLPQRLRLFVAVVRAVAYAHSRLVLHRDLKPANVLVDAEQRPHLLDFGIAAVLGAAAGDAPLACTPRYAAPELRAGGELSVQVDVYALGVMLAELAPEADADLAA
ncbi:MAG TPA: serine/threonine-protein kinase, partial [Roseateles sp.]